MPHTSDTAVQAYDPLLAAAALLDELPLDDGIAKAVEQARVDICSILDRADDRLLVVVGPFSGERFGMLTRSREGAQRGRCRHRGLYHRPWIPARPPRALGRSETPPLRLWGQRQLSTLSGTAGNQPGITGKRPTAKIRSSRAILRSAPAP
jgi:hypothetical protein